jgi:uncharacterized protein (UPF0254 family)
VSLAKYMADSVGDRVALGVAAGETAWVGSASARWNTSSRRRWNSTSVDASAMEISLMEKVQGLGRSLTFCKC